MGEVGAKTTDGAGNMTNVGIKYGDAGVNETIKILCNMFLQLTDRVLHLLSKHTLLGIEMAVSKT